MKSLLSRFHTGVSAWYGVVKGSIMEYGKEISLLTLLDTIAKGKDRATLKDGDHSNHLYLTVSSNITLSVGFNE